MKVSPAVWGVPRAHGTANCSARAMEHGWGTRSATSQRGHLHVPHGMVTSIQIVNVNLSGCLVEVIFTHPLSATVQLNVEALCDRLILPGRIARAR